MMLKKSILLVVFLLSSLSFVANVMATNLSISPGEIVTQIKQGTKQRQNFTIGDSKKERGKAVFDVELEGDTKFIKVKKRQLTIPAGKSQLEYEFIIDATHANPGKYRVDFTFSPKGESDHFLNFGLSANLNFEVVKELRKVVDLSQGKDLPLNLELGEIVYPDELYQVGEDFTFHTTVQNNATSDLLNIPYSFKVYRKGIVVSSEDNFLRDVLLAGHSAEISSTFSFQKTGPHLIKVSLDDSRSSSVKITVFPKTSLLISVLLATILLLLVFFLSRVKKEV